MLGIITRWTTQYLIKGYSAKEELLAQVSAIQAQYPNRPIAFVIYGGFLMEFLTLRVLFPKLQTATRISRFLIDGPFHGIHVALSWFGLIKPLPFRLQRCANDLREGRPVLLILRENDRTRPFETPKGEIELEYLQREVPDLLLVPILFLWRKAAKTEKVQPEDIKGYAVKWATFPVRALRSILLGDPYSPTDFRKVMILLRAGSASTLRALSPLEISTDDAAHLRRKLIQGIISERRTIVGPVYKSPKLIGESILRNQKFQNFIRHMAGETGTDERQLLKKATRIFYEIAARYSYSFLEAAYFLTYFIFNTIFDGITTKEEDFDHLRATSKEGPIVFLPNHKSYVDFLVLSSLLFKKDIHPPHIAGGANLNIFPIGRFFRGCGAFFIRRSFRGDTLYTEIMRRYIATLLNSRFNLEFFIEGMRSRNGKLAPPKYGMLGMIVQSYLDGEITENVRLVPVAIAYDKVTEVRSHKHELEGGEKIQESFAGVVKSTKVLFKNYGKVHLRFGEAIRLEDFIKEKIGEVEGQGNIRRLAVQKLAFEVFHRINNVTLLNSTGLVCAAMLCSYRAELLKSDLEIILEQFHQDLLAHKIPMTQELEESYMRAYRRAIARLLEDGVLVKTLVHDGVLLRVPDRQRIAAMYYKNSVIQGFLEWALYGVGKGKAENLLEVRSLLLFDFFFAEKDAFLRRSLELSKTNIPFGLYAHLLADSLQTIQVGLQGLCFYSTQTQSLKEWKRLLMSFGDSEVQRNKHLRREAVNTQSFNAFFDFAKNKGYLVEHGKDLFAVDKTTEMQKTISTLDRYVSGIEPLEDFLKVHAKT